MHKNLNLFSKHYNDFKICTYESDQEIASKILNIDLSSIPYSLFTKNSSEMSEEEASQISSYLANTMYLLDAKDKCDRDGIAYISELFYFKCFGMKLGDEINEVVDEIKLLIPDNDLAGMSYNMSGCNDNNL